MQLTEDLYSLEEPWRTRFLVLIANHATDQQWDGQVPDRSEVVAWLEEDAALQRRIALMLETWRK